jgi:hypothetical protein
LDEPLTGEAAKTAIRGLGTSSDVLRHVVFRGHLERRDYAHPHYPPTTPGFNGWAKANKVCRDLHVPLGWEARDDRGVPKTVAPDGSFAITVLGGNEDTGLPHRIPSTRRPRGGQGAKDVADNRQGDLFEYTPPEPQEKTYYLLVNHVLGPDRSILRAELSLPWQLNDDGHVMRWYRRMILPDTDAREAPAEPSIGEDPVTPDIEVPVVRRSS